jgi:hypothetical protein
MSRELFRLVGVWSGCWVVRDDFSGFTSAQHSILIASVNHIIIIIIIIVDESK